MASRDESSIGNDSDDSAVSDANPALQDRNFTVGEDEDFHVGMEFANFVEFGEKFEAYCRRTGQTWYCRTSTYVDQADRV